MWNEHFEPLYLAVYAELGLLLATTAATATGNSLLGTLAGARIRTGALAVDGQVFAVTRAGQAYARALADGAPVWQQTFEGEINSTPILVDGKLIVASMTGDTLLRALDPESGQVIWSFIPQK